MSFRMPPAQLPALLLPQRPQSLEPALKVKIEWLIYSDMPEVLHIERSTFKSYWIKEDFLHCLRQRNCIGMVAKLNHRTVGFMIYELQKAKIHVLNFAVDQEFRRQDIGTQMVEKLVDNLLLRRLQEIYIEVCERNLVAQLFFKRMGFKAVLVLYNHYNDTDEDAYVMRFSIADDNNAEYLPSEYYTT